LYKFPPQDGGAQTKIEVPIYRDFASVPCPDVEEEAEIVDDEVEAPQRTPGKKTKNFVVQLHSILSELERDGLDTIAAWQPHGRAFVVKQRKEFVSSFLSK
jgi:hypothetical protein